MSKPTIQQIFEELLIAEEVACEYGYRIDGDRILMETYTEDGNVDAVYPLTITVDDPL
ncbi:hypothetical protein ACX80U_05755 [Arthrobacter sp. TmT3-37]